MIKQLFTGAARERDQNIQRLEDFTQRLMSEPFPGPFRANFSLRALGIKLGINNIGAQGLGALGPGFFSDYNQVTRRAFNDLTETIIHHGFGHSFSDTSVGQDQLELCKLRYQAILLALDSQKSEPEENYETGREKAQQIVDKMEAIFNRNQKMRALSIREYTDALSYLFDIRKGKVSLNEPRP